MKLGDHTLSGKILNPHEYSHWEDYIKIQNSIVLLGFSPQQNAVDFELKILTEDNLNGKYICFTVISEQTNK